MPIQKRPIEDDARARRMPRGAGALSFRLEGLRSVHRARHLPRALRQTHPIGVLLAVIAIAVAATIAIVLLQRAAEQQHQAEVLVVRIEELSQEMVALERLAERDQSVDADTNEEFAALQQQMAE